MRKYTSLMLVAFVVMSMAFSTGCTKVAAGYVGVKVYLTGGSKGVSNEVLTPGRYYIGVNEELYPFPTFQQNYSWTANPSEGSPTNESFNIQTAEGQVVNCDIAITYHYDVAKISDLFQKFREGNDEIRDKQLHNFVRNAMNMEATKYQVSEIYGPKKVEFITAVTKDVRAQVAPEGIVVDDLSLIGAFRLPESVTAALNAKNAAVQKAQQIENEVAQSKDEAEKAVAVANGEAQAVLIRAKAQAMANRELSASLTRELIESKKVEKWDGVYPLMVSGGQAGNILINTDSLISHGHKAAPAAAKAEDKDE